MSEKKRSKHIIIPCSGIGKAVGTITRRATYIVTEELLPNDTDSICFPLLTIKDKETVHTDYRSFDATYHQERNFI